MPDLIQFDCPSCAATLRIPLEMAAVQAPCPLCHEEIVAPDPQTGVGAHLPVQPQATPPPSPAFFADPEPEVWPAATLEPAVQIDRPFSGSTESQLRVITPKTQAERNAPLQYRKIESAPAKTSAPVPRLEPFHEPEDEYVALPPPPPPSPKRRSMVIPACLLTAALCLAAGFGVGIYLKGQQPPPIQLHIPADAPKAPVAKGPVTPTPQPDAPVKAVEPIAPAVKKTTIEAAQATLRAFLEAPDWAARSAYVLAPETTRPKMEAYSRNGSDGPTPFDSFEVKHSQVDEKSGTTLFVFQVSSPVSQGGIPVAILETKNGWLVDWESFVEFRDDQFSQLAEGPADHSGVFHLIISDPPNVPPEKKQNADFVSFQVEPPIPGRQRTAFVKRSNPILAQLTAATANGMIFTPVLEIAKRSVGTQTYLEIVSLKASDWRPRP